MILAPRVSLRDYQREAIRSLTSAPAEVNRQLIVISTGGGKTVVMSALLDETLRPGRRALVLAHREELLIQAKEKIEAFSSDLVVELEQAENRASRDHGLFGDRHRHVVVGSIQTLRGKRLQSWAPDAFDLVIIDEAHHATASSYTDILEYFGCMNGRTPLVGVTATPNRSDGVGLGAVFQRIACNYGIKELVEKQYLCPIRAVRVDSTNDISSIKATAGDFNAGELEEAVDDDGRNALIVAAYRKYAPGRPGVAFTAGVKHAFHLAQWFIDAGISAEPVWGAMEREARRATLDRYRSGETMILTNHSILTEGWDEPKTSCILLCRPTKSALVVTQQIGRGTRLFPGKQDCLVIDVKDVVNGKSVVAAATLAGLPSTFKPTGEDIFRAAQKYEMLSPSLAERATSTAEIEALLERQAKGLAAAEIDIMTAVKVDPAVQQYSRYRWSARNESFYSVSPDKGETTFTLEADTLGKWYVRRQIKGEPAQTLAYVDHPGEAFKVGDAFVSSGGQRTTLIEQSAKWHSDKPSEKQLAILNRNGVIYPTTITKGEASALIDATFARKNRRAA